MDDGFQQDCVALAHELYARGRLGRRGLIAALGAVLGLPRAVAAQAGRELVMANWGGIATAAFGRFYGEPFAAAHPGVRVLQDGAGPSAARIRAMVESRRVTWDLCDSSTSVSTLLGAAGLLERVDYGVVRRQDVLDPTFALDYGAAPYSFSTVLVYDSARFPAPPRGWPDFFDLRAFPGTRLLRRDATAMVDIAAVAAGADPIRMYPLDTGPALDLVRRIRADTVFWGNGAESEQLMRDGKAAMGAVWHTRAKVLETESGGRFRFIWNQAALQAGIFVIPRGNPGGALAQRLLASMLARPEPQVGLLQMLGNGPTNPRAASLVPAELRHFNPTDPNNLRQQFVPDGQWWSANYARVNREYQAAIGG